MTLGGSCVALRPRLILLPKQFSQQVVIAFLFILLSPIHHTFAIICTLFAFDEFHLTRDNYRCHLGGRVVQEPLPEWYIPVDGTDTRSKTLFTVSNLSAEVELEVVILSDSGASEGLTLPARKIIALQLVPVLPENGGRKSFKTAGNKTFKKIRFQPAVVLRVRFVRLDGLEDTRACSVLPWCHEEEYNSLVADLSVEKGTTYPPAEKQRAESHFQLSPQRVSSSSLSKVIATTSLFPTAHRSMFYPSDTASIGMGIMQELGVHITCCENRAVLEIKEDSFIYDEE